MRRFLLLAALCTTAGLAQAQVAGSGLLDVYREALDNNADLAAERAGLGAQREAVPQARAGLLPQLGLGAQFNDTHTSLDETARDDLLERLTAGGDRAGALALLLALVSRSGADMRHLRRPAADP